MRWAVIIGSVVDCYVYGLDALAALNELVRLRGADYVMRVNSIDPA